MVHNYKELRAENERRYGTDIGRIGRMLLSDRYDTRTHFIFELLQNAEDALRRRTGWQGSRTVHFELTYNCLRISHYGLPFSLADVRGICGIDESTKDITSIGRFGIGFKSVYAITDRPEVHSGDEAFAIESYVWPVAVAPVAKADDETVILLPLKPHDTEAFAAIAVALSKLGARTLLFLREVEEISWSVDGGATGFYLRGKPVQLGDDARFVVLLGEQEGQPDVSESWTIFSREVESDGKAVGATEIAFATEPSPTDPSDWFVVPITESPLIVFFPTALATHLGFLVQGPYRTTPSRDNIPREDDWNERLVSETGELLLEALRWLRDANRLTVEVLECLPIDRTRSAGNLLEPLFEQVVAALKTEPLLPSSSGGYVPADGARLSRTQDLRELISPQQLGSLLGSAEPITWLSGDITADRTPELRQFMVRSLGVGEVTPDALVPRLTKSFLEAQQNGWIERLYQYLGGQPALARQGRLDGLPLVRLESGHHVSAIVDGVPQAFLPTSASSSFPTVLQAVCSDPEARAFLQSLGLTPPDPVDEVIRNLLPRYQGDTIEYYDYGEDIGRILQAATTDSRTQKDKLIEALRKASFVMVRDQGTEEEFLGQPQDCYLAAARMKALFAGVPDVYIVDDTQACLRGEPIRDLLEACGAVRHLHTEPVASTLTWEEKRQLRHDAGAESYSQEIELADVGVRGLEGFFGLLPNLSPEDRKQRARLLWDALAELHERRGASVFSGEYSWRYFNIYKTTYDASFLRQLNTVAWVPDSEGELQRPTAVVFETLDWTPDPFLLSKIEFRPRVMDTLAREVGIDPQILDMLKALNLTTIDELRRRLGLDDTEDVGPQENVEAVTTPESDQVTEAEREEPADDPDGQGTDPGARPPDPGQSTEPATNAATNSSAKVKHDGNVADGPNPRSPEKRPSKPGGSRRFISYVAVDPTDEGPDPDGLDNLARMNLEAGAIDLIVAREPSLARTPPGTVGFDLLEADLDGEPERWVEVKAMTGNLQSRPVGLSSAQFEFARRHGDQYWLYVVEQAGSKTDFRIVKIQNPAGRTGYFTFDRGWIHVADLDPPAEA